MAGEILALTIDPDAINKKVADAIIESVLGKEMDSAIQKGLAEVTKRGLYNNSTILEQVVTKEINHIVSQLLNGEYRPLLEQKVREALTDEAVSKVVSTAVEALLNKLER